MFVDKSHSKKDIINLFRKLGIIISKDESKGEIISSLDNYIDKCNYNDYIKNPTELIEYLSKPSPKQRPSVTQKNEIMFLSKKIIKWSNNNYILDGRTYNNGDEIFQDVMKIYKFGDTSAVRKACRLYNISPYCINHVNPVVSEEVKQEMENNKIIKQQYMNSLIIRRAAPGEKIMVYFD
tara:strand:+ start:643 stop:1182 length:540 start_codon:yes stop_codon:yes gene_type:complete